MCAAVVADCACEGLRRTARAVSRVYGPALRDVGLTPTQLAILVATRLHVAPPLSRLAEGLGLERTALYRAVAPLERAGYVRTSPGRTERERVVTVTPRGELLLRQALPLWEAAQARLIDAVGVRAWAALSASLKRVLAAARTLEGAGRSRARPRRAHRT